MPRSERKPSWSGSGKSAMNSPSSMLIIRWPDTASSSRSNSSPSNRSKADQDGFLDLREPMDRLYTTVDLTRLFEACGEVVSAFDVHMPFKTCFPFGRGFLGVD